MTQISFKKMHGLGNDFVVVDGRDGLKTPDIKTLQAMADRRLGIGCDQILFIRPPKSEGTDVFLEMYNSDGSPLRACGNGTRCVADIIAAETGKAEIVLETVAGFLHCRKEADGRITADMGVPKTDWKDIPLSEERDTLHLGISKDALKNPVAVNMGNPHAVFFVDGLKFMEIEEYGAFFEKHALFPDRANIEFVEVKNRNELRMRVWERGAGVTMACGTGACASLVAAVRRGLSDRKAKLVLDGGELNIEWREDDGHVLMTGPVAYVFDGIWKHR
ncbi:MAG TPA: diaminopimelate epimerase [Alphaproteobacteria bacterium]|nr:diaminopimelate epimerase [Alphaproteobacteria bacterium]